MIIVDRELERREEERRPVRVGLVGAGYMGRGVARQVVERVPGMRLAGIVNRTLEKAESAYRASGLDGIARVETPGALEEAADVEVPAVSEDFRSLTRAGPVDVVIEATGHVEHGAQVALDAIEHGKHVVLMNAELDATVGPALKSRADRAGVVITNTDGDQPGVVMNLLRFVRTIGYRPLMAGNIKGLLDPYRTPATQEGFAKRHGQDVKMITSFADGTKLAMEMAVVANATGFGVAREGMHGPACEHVDEAAGLFSAEALVERGGIVDYVLGARPGPGVFVLGYDDDPARGRYMEYFKMGPGPIHVFHVPYHLPHLEAPISAARAALFRDPVIAPRGEPVCEVVAAAKRDLAAGEWLDGIGGFTCYGIIDNSDRCRQDDLLPMGLAEGARLIRDLPRDEPIGLDDVELPTGRSSDLLWREQYEGACVTS